MISMWLGPLRSTRLAGDLKQSQTWSKLSHRNYKHLTAIFSALGYRPLCRGATDAWMAVVTTLRCDVYHLLHVCHACIEVRKKVLVIRVSITLLYETVVYFLVTCWGYQCLVTQISAYRLAYLSPKLQCKTMKILLGCNTVWTGKEFLASERDLEPPLFVDWRCRHKVPLFTIWHSVLPHNTLLWDPNISDNYFHLSY